MALLTSGSFLVVGVHERGLRGTPISAPWMPGAPLSCDTQRYQQRSPPGPCPLYPGGHEGHKAPQQNPALRGGSRASGRAEWLPLAALGVLAGGASGARLEDGCAKCCASQRTSGGSWAPGPTPRSPQSAGGGSHDGVAQRRRPQGSEAAECDREGIISVATDIWAVFLEVVAFRPFSFPRARCVLSSG